MSARAWAVPGCRVVCRPNRTDARTFKTCDVARVARYAAQSGEPWELIIAAVLRESDVREEVCAAARGGGEALGAIRGAVEPIRTALGHPQYERLLRVLRRVAFLLPKRLAALLLSILVVLRALKRILDAIDALPTEAEDELLRTICEADPCARGQRTTEDNVPRGT